MPSFVDDNFDKLAAKFPTAESATRERLRHVWISVFKATLRAQQLGAEFFKATPDAKVPGVRRAFNRDLDRLIKRLALYRNEIMGAGAEQIEVEARDDNGEFVWCFLEQPEIEPEEEQGGGGDAPEDAPDPTPIEVCVDPEVLALKSLNGLIKRRDNDHPDGLGAGPVPDAAMPTHLIERLGILEQHVEELDHGFFNDMLIGIPDFVSDIADKAADAAGAAAEGLSDAAKAAIKVGAFVLGGLAVFAGGAWLIKRAQRVRNSRT